MWIRFANQRPSTSGKTQLWDVVANEGDVYLGHIAWFGRWRKYAFFPAGGTVFEEQCLMNIVEFCKTQTKAFRDSKKVK